jgi:NAD(P)-dependent dehydrogenase (short-subunit alcohol dehydrogenase family)
MEFRDRVAVVVGGASGIGRGIALELARRGAQLAIADIHDERAAAVCAEIEALGRSAFAARCDVRSDADVDALHGAVRARFGRCDLLVNSAGVAMLGPAEAFSMQDWQWILDVNLLGVIRVCRRFLPDLIAQRSGHIANVASVAGLFAYSYDCAPYITSKFGCRGYSEALAVYLRGRGIGVSVVCPGLVSTNLGENARAVGIPPGGNFIHFPPFMQRAIPAEAVGPIVCDGIRDGRFEIHTHPELETHIRERQRDLDAAIATQVREMPDPFAGR